MDSLLKSLHENSDLRHGFTAAWQSGGAAGATHVQISWISTWIPSEVTRTFFFDLPIWDSNSSSFSCRSFSSQREPTVVGSISNRRLRVLPINVPRATSSVPGAPESIQCRALAAHAGLAIWQPPCSITRDNVVNQQQKLSNSSSHILKVGVMSHAQILHIVLGCLASFSLFIMFNLFACKAVTFAKIAVQLPGLGSNKFYQIQIQIQIQKFGFFKYKY